MFLFFKNTVKKTKIQVINAKMPTIVGILRFISMINTTSERLKAKYFFICRYFSFYELLKFRAQLSCALKKSGQISLFVHLYISHGCTLLTHICLVSILWKVASTVCLQNVLLKFEYK